MDLTGIGNGNEFFSEHYLAALLEDDLRGLFEKWRAREEAEGVKPPYEALSALARPYFVFRSELERTRDIPERLELQSAFFAKFFAALGYPFLAEPCIKEPADGMSVPISVDLSRTDGHPVLWAIETLGPEREDADPLDLPLLKAQFPEDHQDKAPDEDTSLEDLLTKVIFGADSPPRWVLLYNADALILLDRTKWNQKRLLRFNLREIFSRKSAPTLRAVAALLHRDSLAPEDDVVLLDTLDENSHKHAFAVSEDLKYTVREAVELLGNEAVRYLREDLHEKVYDGALKAEDLTRECLRWVYRMLFLFYVEARPDLGYAPLKSDEYRTGYSLESLRDLVEGGALATEEGRTGTFLDESLRRLFDLVFSGFNHGVRQITLSDLHEEAPDAHTFRMAPLQSHLFDPAGTPTLGRVKFPDETMRQIIEKLSLSKPGRRRARQRISYAQLGINQLGAVYEGLLSYTGFFAEEDLYEVQKAGEAYDELQSAYFVPERDLEKYKPEERVQVDGHFIKYAKGTFIYRLWGRNREKSASYYTPESLTRCVVKYALKELLKDKKADDLLALTICEMALGSGAFVNEAVNQLAEAYLDLKQKETNRTVPHGDYEREKQRVKAYLADNNVYGVDLNPTAVELAEISLWLNTIYEGAAIPWFGNQLAVGNSLVGARRQVFEKESLTGTGTRCPWAETVPARVKPGETRPADAVYHFLVGDPGMADYTDKVVKGMCPNEIKAIKEWRKAFTKPFSEPEVKTLLRLSAAADRLWARHTQDRQEVERRTAQPIAVFGHEQDQAFQSGSTPALSTREKDALYAGGIEKGSPQASAYRRLKLAMDYWCTLWFWPLQKAHLLPSRDEFLLHLQLILEGQVTQTPGTTPIQPDLYGTPTLREQALQFADPYGIVDVEDLCARVPQLTLVKELTGRYRFHHWELAFAEVFAGRGGFDLMVGNPPWIKVEWNESGVMGDAEPLYVLRSLNAPELAELRQGAFVQHADLRETYLAELEEAEGMQSFLNSRQNYPALVGMKANLYKCFLPQAWQYGRSHGVAAFLHPEGVYDEPSGGSFRSLLYSRLRYHFQFQNQLMLFPVAHRERYSVNIYGAQGSVNADSISNLFHPSTIDACFDVEPKGPIPGMKDEDGESWDLRGHAHRIVPVGEPELALFAKLYDELDTPALQARLPGAHSREVVDVLKKFAAFPRRFRDLSNAYYSNYMWHETEAQKDGTIRRETSFPKHLSEWVLSGPHFYVGNPFYKTPRQHCSEKAHYDVLDLEFLQDAYMSRSNYCPACSPIEYLRRTPKVPWEEHKPITAYYRLCFRAMLPPANERTLIGALVAMDLGHINGVLTIAFQDTNRLLSAVFFGTSLVADFFIKTTGRSNLHSTWEMFPLLEPSPATQIRILLLNCLTIPYSDLWTSCWSDAFRNDRWAKGDPRLENAFFTRLTPQWQRDCALRTDYARRQALVEIDVLAAMALGLTCDELCAIYRIQFPVLRQNEEDTWYDRSGRIIFTCSKGLPGVSFKRAEWNRIKDTKDGTVHRTVTDDTLPGGPRQKTITYTAPFDRCDREADYRTAWAAFEARGLG